MKKTIRSIVYGVLGVLLFSASSPYSTYVPILMERSELEKSIAVLDSKVLTNPGKIYVKSDALYVVEKYKGVHVILNADPANPVNKYFIRIPGIVDVAVKANVLYADNAVDLVSVDIASLPTINVLDRVQDVFPELTPPGYTYMPYRFQKYNRPDNTIIVEWKTMEL